MLRTKGKKARLLLAACAVAGAALASPAGAATASNLTPVNTGYNDSFWNYDFASTAGGNTNVDWAVSLLFYGGADINRVKNAISSYYGSTGSTKYARLSDGTTAVWDADGGMKTIACPIGTSAYHYRVYADADDRMYNANLGYYVFGTTHIDTNECGGGTRSYGNSEATELNVGNNFTSRGYSVYRDWADFFNYEPDRVEGDHRWYNNGYASYIYIP
jgi:hypothetical protein